MKLFYLLGVLLVLFVWPSPVVMGVLTVLQVILWAGSFTGWRPLARTLKRLAVFFCVITLSYLFMPVGEGDRWTNIALGPWTVGVNLGGLSVALLMCLRVLLLILASVWVQEGSTPQEFVHALERLHVPRFMAAAISGTIRLASGGSGDGTGGGGGGGRGKHGMTRREALSLRFEQIREGKLSFIREMVLQGLSRAERFVQQANPTMDRRQAQDVAVIVGIATAIMGTKVIQILPGLPIAPGHKNVLIIPLLLLAAGLTHARLGGLWTGLTAGIVSVLSGYGKFGVLEIAHYAVPGLLADLLLPLTRFQHPLWLRFVQFGIIGGVLGLGRFAANFLVIVLAGAPGMAFVLYVPMLVSQVAFGALSAFVSLAILDLVSDRRTEEPGSPPLAGMAPGGHHGDIRPTGGGGHGGHRAR
jgi:hypothetical protein